MSKIAVVCVVFVVFVFGSMGVEMNKDMIPIITECATENSIGDIKENILSDKSRMNNHEYRCFLRCVASKAGLTDPAGELDIEKITQAFHPSEQNLRVITQCIDNNKQAEICDRVAFAHICVMQELKFH